MDLPHLKDEPEINSYSLKDFKDTKSDMGNLQFNFKVLHSNLLAFSTQCVVYDDSIMERISKNKITWEQ